MFGVTKDVSVFERRLYACVHGFVSAGVSSCMIFILCCDRFENLWKFPSLNTVLLIGVLESIKFVELRYLQSVIYEKDLGISKSAHTFKAWKNEKGRSILSGMLLLMAVVAFYVIASVLFGASIIGDHESTLTFAILLTILTALPVCCTLGPNAFLPMLCGERSKDEINISIQHTVGASIIGAWFGAFVIPLDWDRPWQVWPLPCCYGALLGYVTSNLMSSIYYGYQLYRSKCRRKQY